MNRPKRPLDIRTPCAEAMESRAMAGSLLDALVLGVLAGTIDAPAIEPTGHTAASAAPAILDPAPPGGREEGPAAIPVSQPVVAGESVSPAESKYAEPPTRVSGPLTDLDQARAELWASSIGPWVYRDAPSGSETGFSSEQGLEGFARPRSSTGDPAATASSLAFASIAPSVVPPFAIITADKLEKGQPPVANTNSYSSGISDFRLAAADLIDVTFSGADLITIEADPGDPAYEGPPQWLDNNGDGEIDPAYGDRSLPVGYPRGSHVTVAATFKWHWSLGTGQLPEDQTKY